MMDKGSGQLIPPRSSIGEFSVGDCVLYTLTRGGRRFTAQVSVREKWLRWTNYYKENVGWLRRCAVRCYIVSSGRGGTMEVLPAELRPDTVLDRILVAIDTPDAA